MRISLPKLKAILLYFATHTDRRYLGKVKLMKLFYFLDFIHTKKYGAPVTYDTYINLEHGPIPTTIKNLVDTAADDVDSSVLADTVIFERPAEFDMYRLVPTRELRDRDLKMFSESEITTLQEVCKRFGDRNTKYIKDASHTEAPWRNTKFLDPIPYELAAKDPDSTVSVEEIQALLSLVK